MMTQNKYGGGRRPSAANRDRLNFLLLASAGALLGGCVIREYAVAPPPPVVVAPAPVVGTEIVATEPAPAPIVEAVTVAPAAGLLWIPGVWVWEGRWIWEGGRWARPPFPGAAWAPHRYVYRNGVHVFVRGGWRR